MCRNLVRNSLSLKRNLNEHSEAVLLLCFLVMLTLISFAFCFRRRLWELKGGFLDDTLTVK